MHSKQRINLEMTAKTIFKQTKVENNENNKRRKNNFYERKKIRGK